MASILTGDHDETVRDSTMGTVRVLIKDAVKEAMYEHEAEQRRGSRGGTSGAGVLFATGAVLGYVLRGRTDGILSDSTDMFDEDRLSEAAEKPTEMIEERTEYGESDSGGGGLFRVLLVTGTLVLASYALRRRFGSPTEAVEEATDRIRDTAEDTADRTEEMTDQAAERTEAVAGDVADRIEEGGEEAADRIDETGEDAAERVEMGGHETADKIDETAEEAEEGYEEATDEDEDDVSF